MNTTEREILLDILIDEGFKVIENEDKKIIAKMSGKIIKLLVTNRYLELIITNTIKNEIFLANQLEFDQALELVICT